MDEQLLAAIEARDIERVKVLLAAYQLAKYGSDEIKCSLIEAGAEDSSLQHSLVWAVGTGRIETVKTLLQKCADVNTVSVGLGSPLLEAARKGNLAEVKFNGRNWIRTSDPVDVNDVL